MRDNGVDMWIHVIRDGDPDALALDLGGDLGTFVFTDRGGDRIERAVFGGTREGFDEGAYDIIAGSDALGRFVAERDPAADLPAYADGRRLLRARAHHVRGHAGCTGLWLCRQRGRRVRQ